MRKNTFAGFSPKARTFFRQLARNNSRDWFTPRKDEFAKFVYEPMTEMIAHVNDDLRKFAVDYLTEPKKALYRIYRDTRFSKDKTPYKDHLGAMFPRQGLPKNTCAGFYYSIGGEEVEIAGGMYMPGPEELSAVRQAILVNEKRFRTMIGGKKLISKMGKMQGESFVKVPKQFPSDSSAADLLKMKQMYYSVRLDAKIALTPKFQPAVIERFKLLTPFVDFINGAILSARTENAEKDERPKRPEPMF